jgi:hypothetical protein
MTSTVAPDGASLHRYPRTSCLATINLSLRDKSHSPIEAPHNFLSAYGFNPRLNGTKLRRLWAIYFVLASPQNLAQFSSALP